jgi:hypothetical protein
MTSHCPNLVQISLIHKYMTSHCADLVQIPLTHKYMSSHCPGLVPGQSDVMYLCVRVSSQDSEMSCICVLGVSCPDLIP